MVNNSTNINKKNNHLSPQAIEHKQKSWNMELKILVLVWYRYKYVAGLNWLIIDPKPLTLDN